MKYGNMHLHSVYSDGVLTPMELCVKAKEMGYKALSLTDHYNVNGYKALKEAAEQTGMEYILGMEGNGLYQNKSCHIVGYDFDADEPKMAEYLKYHNDSIYYYTKAKFEALIKSGAISGITWNDVLEDAQEGAWLCNEHIFASLVKRTGITQANYREFFLKFMAAKPETTIPPIKHLTAEDMIKTIRNAGGIASLAHPHGITKFLPEFYTFGLNCVEYDHPDIDSDDINAVLEFVKGKKMYVSGGTDHTGQLSNFPFERELDPDDRDACFLVPLTTDVRNGVTKEEFLNLKNRIYG